MTHVRLYVIFFICVPFYSSLSPFSFSFSHAHSIQLTPRANTSLHSSTSNKIMVQFFDNISDDHAEWIRKQRIFFVGTAPLDGRGTVNNSPKGYDCLRVLNSNQVCYLEMSGKLTFFSSRLYLLLIANIVGTSLELTLLFP